MAFELKHGLCLLLVLSITILVLCPDPLHEKFESAKVHKEYFVQESFQAEDELEAAQDDPTAEDDDISKQLDDNPRLAPDLDPEQDQDEEYGTMPGYLKNRGIRLKPGSRGPDHYELPSNAETVPGAPYDTSQRQVQLVGMETFYPKPKQRVFEGFSGKVLMPTETQRA